MKFNIYIFFIFFRKYGKEFIVSDENGKIITNVSFSKPFRFFKYEVNKNDIFWVIFKVLCFVVKFLCTKHVIHVIK